MTLHSEKSPCFFSAAVSHRRHDPMPKNEKIPDWFLWTWDHFPGILIIGLLVGMIVVGGVAYVDSRLSDIEGQLNSAPPRSYAPPELDAFDAGDTKAAELANKHLVYVPVYSHIYYRGGSPYPLETTLSIRNVDAGEPIYVESVDYYDTTGKLAKTYVDRLIKLAHLQTIEILVGSRDSSGGSGANFLVRWGSTSDADKPMIESVMVGAVGTQGISFGRSGIEISRRESNDE